MGGGEKKADKPSLVNETDDPIALVRCPHPKPWSGVPGIWNLLGRATSSSSSGRTVKMAWEKSVGLAMSVGKQTGSPVPCKLQEQGRPVGIQLQYLGL